MLMGAITLLWLLSLYLRDSSIAARLRVADDPHFEPLLVLHSYEIAYVPEETSHRRAKTMNHFHVFKTIG